MNGPATTPTRRQLALGLGLAPLVGACASRGAVAEAPSTAAPTPPLLAATLVLVRHAEKADESRDPELSPAGRARAERFADLFEHAGVTGLVHSGLIRTRDTLAPLGARLGLEGEAIPPRDLDALVARLATAGPDEVIAVAGHSNTTPALAWAFGVLLPDLEPVEGLPHGYLPHGAYGRIHVLTPGPAGVARLLELRS